MFAILHGSVNIRGTAGGKNYAFFHLQAGQGMNPQRWLQIGADSRSPVTNGLLGVWDTSGLDGLYAIQLLVVKTDQSLQRTSLLVTIDNTAPQVKIDYPTSAAEISLERGRIILQVQAQDNLGLQNVVFYIDNVRLAMFTQPPYAVGWQVSPGTHILRVVAADQAGNTTESSVEFSVR
jgi:hypothetical protein